MSENGLGLIQKCSTTENHITFLFMADKRYEQGRQKELVWAMVDQGLKITEVFSKKGDDDFREIFLIIAENFDLNPYFSRLAAIFQEDEHRWPRLYITKAFCTDGLYINDNPKEIVNTWFDLEHSVFITFSYTSALNIKLYLEKYVLPKDSKTREKSDTKKSP